MENRRNNRGSSYGRTGGQTASGRRQTYASQRARSAYQGGSVGYSRNQRGTSVRESARRAAGQPEMDPVDLTDSQPTSPKKKRKKKGKIRFALKIFLLIILLSILGGLLIFYFKYGNRLLKWQSEARADVLASTEDTFRSSETSFIYDSKGKKLAKLVGDKDAYYTRLSEIPTIVKDSFIVTEDRDFYEHSGIDMKGTAMAVLTECRRKLQGQGASRGGSTITQQLARGVFLSQRRTYERKIKEIFYAMELEKKYNKDQILEFYINNVYFANGYYGIEAASRGYFSKSADKLTVGEAAFLCTIPNNPNRYNPLDNYDNTVKREQRILDQLLQEKKISAAVYKDAESEVIKIKQPKTVKKQNYMTTYAISCAVKTLMAQNGFKFRYYFNSDSAKKQYQKQYDELYNECYQALYSKGYKIYTSLDMKKQKLLQKSVDDQLKGFTEKKNGVYALQSAATCIDNNTGKVVAIVGGRNQKTTGYTLNRAYQSYRQPGSSFKPLVVYTPCLERNYTPDSIVDDSPFEGGPRNSSGTYSGKIPLRMAVAKSKNVVAWKIFEEMSPSVGLSYVRKMNFARIVPRDNVPAASLGGLTNGASTVEMASGYSTIENEGIYREPTCINKIVDVDGKTIVNNKISIKKKRVYQEDASHEMTEMLMGVLQTGGTAAGHALEDMPCAGKTGTTSDKKDGWFCGYTPYYTTAVWVGYDTPRTLDNLYGGTYPLSIWEEYMTAIHQGKEYKDFPGIDSKKQEEPVNNPNNSWTPTAPAQTMDPDAAEATMEPSQSELPQQTKAPVVTKAPVITKAPVPTQQPPEDVNPGNDDGQNQPPEDVGGDNSDPGNKPAEE